MGASLRKDAETIIADSIREVQPDSAVIRALKEWKDQIGGRRQSCMANGEGGF